MRTALLILVASVVFASACTAQSAYVYPEDIQRRYLITTGDTDQPYESLGYVQLTRKGTDLFGFIPVFSAELEDAFGTDLTDLLARTGADGIINVRFYERQWTPSQRVLWLFLIFGPPTAVEISGELIRFVGGSAAPGDT